MVNPHRLPTRSRAGEILCAVHATPGLTRADLIRSLDISSGLATDTIGRLIGDELLDEWPAPATHRRGRPTRCLRAHSNGPLAAVVAISRDRWEVVLVQLGGDVVRRSAGSHERRFPAVAEAVTAALDVLCAGVMARIRALSISVPGTVSGTRVVDGVALGWRDVDLAGLHPPGAFGDALLVGSDVTLSALAEARRGAAMGSATSLHLYMDSGVRGALLEGGQLVAGARGMAGEYGHMPVGVLDARCRCGALGCWNTSLDAVALARALGRDAPTDELTFVASVLEAARSGSGAEIREVKNAAAAFGRGVAGLVNALDPDCVTLGGLASLLLEVEGLQMQASLRNGLMGTIARRPPRLTTVSLGDRAPLIGAADHAFDTILTDSALASWNSARPRLAVRRRSR